MPAVSVVIPAFNAAAFLDEAVASVQAQTMSDWELIIVDDGSTDATPQVLARLADGDPRIRAVRQENRGAGAARNAAIKRSTSDWIALLDADDMFLPDKLQRQLACAAADDCDVIFGAVELFGDTQRRCYAKWCRREEFSLAGSWGVWQMIGHNCVPLSSVLVRRQLLNNVGGFDERRELQNVEDLQVWLRLLTHGARFRYLPQADTRYRVHGDNASGQDRLEMKRRRITALANVQLHSWLCDLRRRAKILELQCALARHWLKRRVRRGKE